MKISAVIPAYNSQATIIRAIDSVLKQTRPADEIIVIDDGSTDNTAGVVRSYGNQVHLIQQENAGVSIARNTGINAAIGNWIVFLDSDDEWFATYLEKQTELIKQNPDLAWSCANFQLRDNNKNERLKVPSEKIIRLLHGKDYFEDYFDAFVSGFADWPCTMMIQKQALIEAGLFLPNQPVAEDLDLWWRIAYLYPKIGCISEPLAVYHVDTADSATKVYRSPQFITDLLNRHVFLAEKSNNFKRFKPCAQHMLRYWVHKYLMDDRIYEIKGMVKQFKNLLPCWYKIVMAILTQYPTVTKYLLPILRKVNRLIRLKI